MAAKNETNAARARSLENQMRALELRRAGRGYVEIGLMIGLSKSQAHRLVQAGLEDAKAQIECEASELKAEEISRLDAMLGSLWEDAMKGSHGAVDRVLKIMERRAKMLGLDAPIKTAVGGDSGMPPLNVAGLKGLGDDELAAMKALLMKAGLQTTEEPGAEE